MSFLPPPRLGRKPWIIPLLEALAIFAAAGVVLVLGMGIIPNFIPPA